MSKSKEFLELLQMDDELGVLEDAHNLLIRAYNDCNKAKECIKNLKDLGYDVQIKINSITRMMLDKSDKNIQSKKLSLIEYARNNGFEDMILDATIFFMAKDMDNHELGDLLQETFPKGVDDSELGQGFFFINKKYANDVLEFLKKHATDVNFAFNTNVDLIVLNIDEEDEDIDFEIPKEPTITIVPKILPSS